MARISKEIQQKHSELVQSILKHDALYYDENQPEISDGEYDELHQQLEEIHAKYPSLKKQAEKEPVDTVGAPPNEIFQKVKHSVAMLSLENAMKESDIPDFVARMKKNLGDKDYEYLCEAKIDGLSLAIRYENGKLIQAATRGDGQTGEDVTHNAKTIKDIPHTLKGKFPKIIEIRGEVFITREGHAKFNDAQKDGRTYSNPRNSAAGALRQKNTAKAASRPLEFIPWGIGEISDKAPATQEKLMKLVVSLGFRKNPVLKVSKDIDELLQFHAKTENNRKKIAFDMDGIVWKMNDISLQEKVGSHSRAPRWAIAQKFAPEKTETKVLDIALQVGRSGTISPVAVLEPVSVGGVTVSRTTLHNEDHINDLDIRVGDTVKLHRAGDVIPQITAVLKEHRPDDSMPFEFPDECPECGSMAYRHPTEAAWKCSDPDDCPAVRVRVLKYFCGKKGFNIDGLGETQIEELWNWRYLQKPADLFILHKHKDALSKKKGWGEVSVTKLLEMIDQRRVISPGAFLNSFGINLIGKSLSHKIMAYYGNSWNTFYDTIRKISQNQHCEETNEFLSQEGFGHKALSELVNFFCDEANLATIDEMVENGVQIEQETEEFVLDDLEDSSSSGYFQGKNLVFTGAMSQPRSAMESLAIRQGGALTSGSVTKKTDYLVVGDKPGSKLKKAESLGIEVLEESQFWQLIDVK